MNWNKSEQDLLVELSMAAAHREVPLVVSLWSLRHAAATQPTENLEPAVLLEVATHLLADWLGMDATERKQAAQDAMAALPHLKAVQLPEGKEGKGNNAD